MLGRNYVVQLSSDIKIQGKKEKKNNKVGRERNHRTHLKRVFTNGPKGQLLSLTLVLVF